MQFEDYLLLRYILKDIH